MRIEANKFVALDYTLTLDSGDVVDRSEEGDPLGFIYGSGTIIDGLEKALLGLEAGAKAKVTVEAEDAYGPVRTELVQRLPKQHFPENVKEGMTFEAEGPHGPVLLLVREVGSDGVLVDSNHPLAGQRLHFDVHVNAVRDPTPEDLAALEAGCGSNDCEGDCHCH